MTGPRSRKPARLADDFAAAVEQMSPEQLRGALAQVLDVAANHGSPRARRRGSRSAVQRRLTLRVELEGAEPPVWRSVEVPSFLTLEKLHGVVQALFGWTDSHLHRFAIGDSVWDAEEVYIGPAELEEADGEQVVLPGRAVRLDEVLFEPGQELRYVYDYGDNWELLLTVEQAQPLPTPGPDKAASGATSRAQDVRLVDGRGLAPPEDVGGVWAWNDGRPDAPLDRAGVDEALALWRSEQGVPPELTVLLAQVRGSRAELQLRDLLSAAHLSQDFADAPVAEEAGGGLEVTSDQARALIGRFLWLLDKVSDGVTLTAAGWLPPAVVTEAMSVLWPPDTWIGKANREDLTEPVRRLRATAQRLGLVRVLKGRLLLTRVGAALRNDPLALWAHVADRAVGKPRNEIQRLATLLRLLELAASAGGSSPSLLPGILEAAGWRASGGEPISPFTVEALSSPLDELLTCLATSQRRGSATEGLDVLARRALRQP